MTEHRREYLRNYHREYYRKGKSWARNHREERRAYFKTYYQKNKEKWGIPTSPLFALLRELINVEYESSESN